MKDSFERKHLGIIIFMPFLIFLALSFGILSGELISDIIFKTSGNLFTVQRLDFMLNIFAFILPYYYALTLLYMVSIFVLTYANSDDHQENS